MIISDNEIQDRFKGLLKDYTRVDIATAWATGGEHLTVLTEATNREHQPVKVRAIVGTAGNATRPDALEELYEITNGDLRLVRGEDRLFHPKLYLFRRNSNGRTGSHAWVGSANFTTAGFGRRGDPMNEELVVQLGPSKTTDALAAWFRNRWKRYHTDTPVRAMIDQYTKDWNPPSRDLRKIVSGAVFRRFHLLDDAHRPKTLEGYLKALKTCEAMLHEEEAEWRVLGLQDQSYMKAISRRQTLLLGEKRWSQLDPDSKTQLKGGVPNTGTSWWGLLGRLSRGHEKAVWAHEEEIRRVLDKLVSAEDTEFPQVAVAKLKELKNIDQVSYGTATLLLALARPDRVVSLNGASERWYGKLTGEPYSTLGEPENYRKLLHWLYAQPWYAGPPPRDQALAQIWRFRAALVDAFVYKWTR